MSHRKGLGNRLAVDEEQHGEQNRCDRDAERSKPTIGEYPGDGGRSDLRQKRNQQDRGQHAGEVVDQISESASATSAVLHEAFGPHRRDAEQCRLGGGEEDGCGKGPGEQE